MRKRMHENLAGMKFGKLKVIEFSYMGPKGHSYWLCQCECGNYKIVRGSHLKSGNVKTCGCVAPRKTHGMSGTRLYNIWENMFQRCYNKTDHAYERYGGRGISVCSEWKDFESFFKWSIDHGYSKSLSIDRKDNDGNYSPSNCRWATPKQQANNTRKNRLITFEGRTQTMIQWAREKGINQSTLSMRINKYGWSAERALRKGV